MFTIKLNLSVLIFEALVFGDAEVAPRAADDQGFADEPQVGDFVGVGHDHDSPGDAGGVAADGLGALLVGFGRLPALAKDQALLANEDAVAILEQRLASDFAVDAVAAVHVLDDDIVFGDCELGMPGRGLGILLHHDVAFAATDDGGPGADGEALFAAVLEEDQEGALGFALRLGGR